MGAKRKAPQKRISARNLGGRPPKPMPDLIPDTPENVARAIFAGPPKKNWRHPEKSGS